MKNLEATRIRDYVRARYGAIAEQDNAPAAAGCGDTVGGCCGGAPKNDANACCVADETAKAAGLSGCGCGDKSYAEQLGYSAADTAALPAGADLGLGCGNPLALASIKPGETVLDLGSGAGFDCLLAARQLNGTGRVIGVDMTPPMIAKARRNAARAGLANVEFRLGEIEHLPVADATVDLIISNCVINLSPEKAQVFREAFRVLKPGGRLAIADVVATRSLPPELKGKLDAIGACVAGAALVTDLQAMLKEAGFARIDIQPRESSRQIVAQWTDDPTIADFVVSAYLTAYKV
ncbi:MAG: arsenite methyltransferase [Opitutaceae bacterium]|nr:arsenite methyltransferase [Opitutaceae bacterium]